MQGKNNHDSFNFFMLLYCRSTFIFMTYFLHGNNSICVINPMSVFLFKERHIFKDWVAFMSHIEYGLNSLIVISLGDKTDFNHNYNVNYLPRDWINII